MKIIHIVHGKANPTGHNGISRVVYHLNKQEKIIGIDSKIWALVDDAKNHYTQKRDNYVTVECFPRVRSSFFRNEIVEKLLLENPKDVIVHFHLIWFFDKNIIARELNKKNIKFIITTHGTYSKPHAYTGKRILAKWLYEVDYLNMATEVHAITREEGTGLSRYGYVGKTFVAYNGIDLDEVPAQRNKNYFNNKSYADKIKIIWVGVLREDKNLRALISAIANLPVDIKSKLICIFVGPDYKGNAKKYIDMAAELSCASNFDYIGPLYGQEKYDAIESADFYVMPSVSEVFSLAMLDAMACAKPCLVSTGCGYNYFIRDNFYIPCEPYSDDIMKGILEMLSCKNDWIEMGNNARRVIEKKLNWKSIAHIMAENYARILKD